jgi:hypothetical protein
VAKSEDSETIMPAAKLKPLLMLSKREPVFCAIGMSKSKDGLVLLDKKAAGRKVMTMLKGLAKKEKVELDGSSLRFGSASVDTAVDSALVTFTVNKDAPGPLRLGILAHLKKAGFSKCEIIVDATLDQEPEEGEADGAAPAEGAAPAAAESAEPALAAAAPETTEDAAPPPAPAAPPGGDAAALTAQLTGLVRRMMAAAAANPTGADPMKAAAVAAQNAIKSGDLATAATQIATLESLLGQAPAAGAGAAAPAAPAAPPPPGKMGSPVFAKARVTWVATRKKVESEIDKLHKEMMSVYAGHGVAADLDKMFMSKVEPIMGQLDESLAEKLDEVSSNSDPATHAKLVDEAKKIIAGYESYLASEPLIASLDKNPFVPLSIQATLTASLAALSKVVA